MENGRNWAGEGQIVVFGLGAEQYGVDIAAVQEIIRVPTITRVPKAPAFVEGVINLRGRVVPVVDLRKRFGLAAGSLGKQGRVVVTDVADLTVGMMVDSVSEVLRVDLDKVEPPPAMTSDGSGCIQGIAKLEDRLVILIDLEQVLTADELARATEMPRAAQREPAVV